MDDEELARQLRAWSPPDTVPATERWRRQQARGSTATLATRGGIADAGEPIAGTQPTDVPEPVDPQVLEPIPLERPHPRRASQRVLVVAAVVVLALVAIYASSRADVTGRIGDDSDVPTTVASTATFGTMPSQPEGGPIDYSTMDVPDYIAVVQGASDEPVGYVRSGPLVNPTPPAGPPESMVLERPQTVLRLYNSSEEVIGYFFPDGPVVGAEADARLATGNDVVDPNS